jgi:hypothetical protein
MITYKSVHEEQQVTPLLVYVIEPQGNCFFKNISVVMYELLTFLFISVALLHQFCVLSSLSKC